MVPDSLDNEGKDYRFVENDVSVAMVQREEPGSWKLEAGSG